MNNPAYVILKQAMTAVVVIFLAYACAMVSIGQPIGTPEAMLVAALALVLSVMMIAASGLPTEPSETEQEAQTMTGYTVDPWHLQQALMRASDQPMADFPTLNKTGILYAALVMEELGETLRGIEHVLHRAHLNSTAAEGSAAIMLELAMHNQANGLHYASQHVRALLQDIQAEIVLQPDEAVELLDGTTDIAVVNSGFALALGLPGAAGYQEVQLSNLSKANPLTGRIDKDPSGKWIKGPDYFKPNLRSVLTRHVSNRDA